MQTEKINASGQHISASHAKRRGRILLISVLTVILAGSVTWVVIRHRTALPAYPDLSMSDTEYSDPDNVIRAISLSYLVYGCENNDSFSGTVSELLDRSDMGILNENSGIVRKEPSDPETALFDTSDFIRNSVGEFRCLCRLKDEKSGFFGAAFCDDVNRCVWIAYSGAISFSDYTACIGLVAAPGFTSQERSAFSLFDTVLQSNEIKNLSYGICLTGHSLGGALATEVSLASGCPAVTVNGADRLAYDKIKRISDAKLPGCRVDNYVTSPDRSLSYMEVVQRLMFLGSDDGVTTHLFEKNGYTTDTHCAFSFIGFSDENFSVPILSEEDE